jgi:lipopolysaccharide transport system ATP-binding protein
VPPAVCFDSVWKKFCRGERHDSLRDLIPAVIKRGVRRSPQQLVGQEFWAVQNVSFENHAGQALGIIGPNGAGKSTTLKLLTRILRPTQGKAEIRGRVGALIEVAAGFHPDLTGKENVYLQGAIMHMKRAEIARKFDDIVDFAGLAPFMDTPVKRYSSGMNARLGFSIAAHLDPNVLLIDEVLAVGDMAFQQRCIDRMHHFKRQGVSIVFVSHNLQAVADLCENSVYLQGEVKAAGPSLDVIQQYVQSMDRDRVTESRGAVEIVSTELLDERGQPASIVDPGAQLRLRVTYAVHEPVNDLLFGLLAYRSTDRLLVYDANFGSAELGIPPLSKGEQLVVDFNFRSHLTRGQYHLAAHVFDVATQEYTSRVSPVGIFSVRENRTFAGIADLQVTSSVARGSLREPVMVTTGL